MNHEFRLNYFTHYKYFNFSIFILPIRINTRYNQHIVIEQITVWTLKQNVKDYIIQKVYFRHIEYCTQDLLKISKLTLKINKSSQ